MVNSSLITPVATSDCVCLVVTRPPFVLLPSSSDPRYVPRRILAVTLPERGSLRFACRSWPSLVRSRLLAMLIFPLCSWVLSLLLGLLIFPCESFSLSMYLNCACCGLLPPFLSARNASHSHLRAKRLTRTVRGWRSFLAWKRLFIAAKSLGLQLPWPCFYRPLVPRALRRASLGHSCSRSCATPATASNGPLKNCCNRLSLTSSGSRSGWSGCPAGRGKQVPCVGHFTLLSVLRSCVAARVLSFCWLLELPPAEMTFKWIIISLMVACSLVLGLWVCTPFADSWSRSLPVRPLVRPSHLRLVPGLRATALR